MDEQKGERASATERTAYSCSSRSFDDLASEAARAKSFALLMGHDPLDGRVLTPSPPQEKSRFIEITMLTVLVGIARPSLYAASGLGL